MPATDGTLGLLMVGASGIAFSAQAATGQLAMQHGAPAFWVMLLRGSTMTVVVVASMISLHCAGRHPLPVRHWLGVNWHQRGWLVLRAVFGSTSVGLSFLALSSLPLSDAQALTFMWPCFALVAGYILLGELVRGVEIVGLFGAVIGSVLVARPPIIFGERDGGPPLPDALNHSSQPPAPPGAAPLGVVFAITGACTTGITIVLIRKLVRAVHWTVVLVYQTLGQLTLAPIAMLLRGDAPVLSPEVLLTGLATGILAAIHQVLLAKGLALAKVGPASAMQSLSVLSSFGMQLVVAPDERLDPIEIGGALVITFAVGLILGSKKSPARPAAAAAAPTRTGASAVMAPAAAGSTTGGIDMSLNDAALEAWKLERLQEDAAANPTTAQQSPT